MVAPAVAGDLVIERDGGLRRLLLVVEGAEKRPLEVVLEVVEVGGEAPSSDECVGVLAAF